MGGYPFRIANVVYCALIPTSVMTLPMLCSRAFPLIVDRRVEAPTMTSVISDSWLECWWLILWQRNVVGILGGTTSDVIIQYDASFIHAILAHKPIKIPYLLLLQMSLYRRFIKVSEVVHKILWDSLIKRNMHRGNCSITQYNTIPRLCFGVPSKVPHHGFTLPVLSPISLGD